MLYTEVFLKSDFIWIQTDAVAFADVMSSPNIVVLKFNVYSTFVQYTRASLEFLA